MLDRRPLGNSGIEIGEIGLSLQWGNDSIDIIRRASELGCTLFYVDRKEEAMEAVGAEGMIGWEGEKRRVFVERNGQTAAEGIRVDDQKMPGGVDDIHFLYARYNLVFQEPSTVLMPSVKKLGRGIVAWDILGGDKASEKYKFLVRDGRTFTQSAVQFVLANEYISCAVARVSTVTEAEEVLSAPDAAPMTIADLENIFEEWSGRCG